jgi:hypothetical protein
MDWKKILKMIDEMDENFEKAERGRKILPKIPESTIIKWIYFTAGRLLDFVKKYDEEQEKYKRYYYSLPRYRQRSAQPPYSNPSKWKPSKWEAIGDKLREAVQEFMDNFRRVGSRKVAVIVDRDEIISRAEYGDEAILDISEFEEIVYKALRDVIVDLVVYGHSFTPYYYENPDK